MSTTRQKEISRLLALSVERYAQREVSKGYWAKERAKLLIRNPQHHTAIVHDLRGTPPVGVIWIRPSTGGKWGKSRREKFGPSDTTLPGRKIKAAKVQTVPTLAERLAVYKTGRRVAALTAAGFAVSTNGCRENYFFIGHPDYVVYGTMWNDRAHKMFAGAPTPMQAHMELAAVQEASAAAHDARLEREHKDYSTAAALPAGRIVFTAEGGFRVENN